jgi:5-methylthioadenosine/S-adenosylhomocysteine deaminase
MVEDLGFAPMYTPRVPQGYRLSAEEAYLLARLGAWELLRSGSTTVADNYRHPDSCARAMDEVGLRAFIGGRIHDVDPAALARGEWRYDAAIGAATLHENAELIARWDGHDGGRLHCFLAPHAPDTCSRDLLVEVALVAGHRIWLEPEEITRVGAAGVRVAHVPLGNAASGMVAPIKALEDAGALITLATDTESHDLFEAMRAAISVARVRGGTRKFNARTALRWATANGAAALGLASEVGALAPGMKADVVLLDALSPNLRPIVDGFGVLGVGANVDTVIVDGRVVLEDGRPTRFDVREVVAAAQIVANRLWRESGWTPVLASPEP